MCTFTTDYNMDIKNIFVVLLVIFVLSGNSACNMKGKTINQMAFKARKDKIIEQFPKIPHDEILQQVNSGRLYLDLQERYKSSLITLKTETDADCAKLVVVILTPQVGKIASLGNNYGLPFILKTCDNMGLDFVDATANIESKEIADLTQSPDDGSWTKAGAVFVADIFDSIIRKYDGQRSSKTLAAISKPATFGDLPPKQNEIMDDKNTPYHLQVNVQGLRMDHNLLFPKKKQTVLILGDAKVFSPYLDNEFIATTILQKRFPDKEIINAGMVNYTMEDFESLYREKARFTEPDLVIVCTDGDQVLNNYFSQRNRYSRTQKIYLPTEAEEEFYHQLYGSK